MLKWHHACGMVQKMRLRDLLEFDEIVIQAHDNPDADAIASGFAVYRYLKDNGKEPEFIYGGRNFIRKTNLVMMIEDLNIPIHHVENMKPPQLLLMVDCQYDGGNSAVFPAENVAVIDHHRISTELPELSRVQTHLGACSTLVWSMLKAEGYDIRHNREMVTALYYGLYTDTSGFTEIVHPLDKDLRDETEYDKLLMQKYRNANMTLEDLEVAGAALLHSDYLDAYRVAIVKSAPCDPNVLGIISDLILEVDAVDLCIVFNVQKGGVKISVRSCVEEVKASELAAELCKGIGSGGGHVGKAGGFIQMDHLTKEYLAFCEQQNFSPRMEYDEEGINKQPTASGIKAVIEQRFREYMDDTDILYADECRLNVLNAKSFCPRMIPWGYVPLTDLLPEGTPVTVRTVHGDVNATVQEGIILTVGPRGEIYFRRETEFRKQYRIYPEWDFHLADAEYEPIIKASGSETVIIPLDFAKVCVPKGNKVVYAKQLDRKVKLFKEGDAKLYSLGRVGDYLLDSTDQLNGIHIMKKERFEKTYRMAKQQEEIKAVIFDLDGTLLDTLEDLKEAVNAALLSMNMPVCTLEQVRHYVGNGVRRLMQRAVPDGENNPKFEETFAAFKEFYGGHCLDHTKPYPNVLELLQELKERGVKTAIVSNKLDSAVKELDKRFFGGYTTTAIGERENVARKPAPDMVNEAVAVLGTERSKTLYVGDSEVDIMTAENAGLSCISVTWGFRSEKFLKKNGAKTLIQTPLDLLYLI